MGKETNTLVTSTIDQYARVWDMWAERIEDTPEEQWQAGDIDYLIPARHLVHVLVATDNFTRDIPFEQYDPTALFGGGSWGMAPEELPTREAALAKLAEIREEVEERLGRLDDDALLEPEQVHLWTGRTRLDKLYYVLRHTQHHLGEINAELIRRGLEGIRSWK